MWSVHEYLHVQREGSCTSFQLPHVTLLWSVMTNEGAKLLDTQIWPHYKLHQLLSCQVLSTPSFSYYMSAQHLPLAMLLQMHVIRFDSTFLTSQHKEIRRGCRLWVRMSACVLQACTSHTLGTRKLPYEQLTHSTHSNLWGLTQSTAASPVSESILMMW